MQVQTLKDLEQLIKLCRKTGIESITVDNLTIKLGEMPTKQPTRRTKQLREAAHPILETAPGAIPTAEDVNKAMKEYNDKVMAASLSEEQMLYWSATGEPS